MSKLNKKSEQMTYERTKDCIKITGPSKEVSQLVKREQIIHSALNVFRPFLWLWSFFK